VSVKLSVKLSAAREYCRPGILPQQGQASLADVPDAFSGPPRAPPARAPVKAPFSWPNSSDAIRSRNGGADQLFAGSGFAQQELGGIGGRNLGDTRQNTAQARRRTHDFLAQRQILFLQAHDPLWNEIDQLPQLPLGALAPGEWNGHWKTRREPANFWSMRPWRMGRQGPVNPVICMYDLTRFSGELAIDIIGTHPTVILGGILHENSFFVPSDESRASGAPSLRRMSLTIPRTG
jgi:hypothetical protein